MSLDQQGTFCDGWCHSVCSAQAGPKNILATILPDGLLLIPTSWPFLELSPCPEPRGALAKMSLPLCTTLPPSWLHHGKFRLRTFAASGWRVSLYLLGVLSLQNLDASSTMPQPQPVLSGGSDLCILWSSWANPMQVLCPEALQGLSPTIKRGEGTGVIKCVHSVLFLRPWHCVLRSDSYCQGVPLDMSGMHALHPKLLFASWKAASYFGPQHTSWSRGGRDFAILCLLGCN